MKKRLLVVDDDPSIRESLKKVLEESGYEVLLAEDGEVAVERLRKERVDLLLLDLEMPKLDGWDVFERVRSRCSLLPVIMITGLATQLETRLIPGLDALIEKPVEVTDLLKRIEGLLKESNAERETKAAGFLERSLASAMGAPGYLRLVATSGSNLL